MTTSLPRPTGLFPHYPVRADRVDLRPNREDDLEDLLAFHSRPEVVRYVPWPVRGHEQVRAALSVKLGQDTLREPGQWLVLAVELRATGRVVGEALLKWESDSSRQGELGFVMHPIAQGQGLAAEAARAVLRLGFDDLELHRISATCIAGNDRSVRTAHPTRHAARSALRPQHLVQGHLGRSTRLRLARGPMAGKQLIRPVAFATQVPGPRAPCPSQHPLGHLLRPQPRPGQRAGRLDRACRTAGAELELPAKGRSVGRWPAWYDHELSR